MNSLYYSWGSMSLCICMYLVYIHAYLVYIVYSWVSGVYSWGSMIVTLYLVYIHGEACHSVSGVYSWGSMSLCIWCIFMGKHVTLYLVYIITISMNTCLYKLWCTFTEFNEYMSVYGVHLLNLMNTCLYQILSSNHQCIINSTRSAHVPGTTNQYIQVWECPCYQTTYQATLLIYTSHMYMYQATLLIYTSQQSVITILYIM